MQENQNINGLFYPVLMMSLSNPSVSFSSARMSARISSSVRWLLLLR